MATRACWLLLMTGLAGAAYAQEPEKPTPPDTGKRAVPDRPAGPESGQRVVPEQPEGVVMSGIPRSELIADHQLGPFVFRPRVTVEFGYDSNVFFTGGGDRIGSRLFNAIGELRMLLPGGVRQEFEFDGTLGYHGFLDEDSQSYTETGGKALYRFKGDRHLFQIGDRYDVSRRRYSLEIDQRVRFITNELRGFYEYGLTKGLGLRFGAHHNDFKFAQGEMFGGIDLPQQGNHSENGLSLSGRVRLASTLRIFGQGDYRRISFEQSEDARDATERTGELGLEFDPAGTIRGEAAIAYTQYRQRDSNGGGSFSGLRARADLKVRLGTSADLELSATREPQVSVLSQSVLNESFRATLSLAASEDLVFNLGVEAIRQQYRGESMIVLPNSSFTGERSDRGFAVEVGANYKLRDNWWFQGRARWFRRNSDVEELNYNEIEALAGFQLTL